MPPKRISVVFLGSAALAVAGLGGSFIVPLDHAGNQGEPSGLLAGTTWPYTTSLLTTP
jgi:hypothetical protein